MDSIVSSTRVTRRLSPTAVAHRTGLPVAGTCTVDSAHEAPAMAAYRGPALGTDVTAMAGLPVLARAAGTSVIAEFGATSHAGTKAAFGVRVMDLPVRPRGAPV